MDSKKIIFITGGVRSGKSQYALTLARLIDGPKIFLATAQPFDADMNKRIRQHKAQRGADFRTIEEPVYLSRTMRDLTTSPAVIVIDCLTIWMNNLFHGMPANPQAREEQQALFLQSLADCPSTIIIVTNEVGMGIIPDNRLSRDFMDALGMLNQRIARMSDEVILMVSGMPQWIKGEGRETKYGVVIPRISA